jgi:hypothetical protein
LKTSQNNNSNYKVIVEKRNNDNNSDPFAFSPPFISSSVDKKTCLQKDIDLIITPVSRQKTSSIVV